MKWNARALTHVQYHYELEVKGSCLSLLNKIKQQLGYCTVKHIQNNINKMISKNIWEICVQSVTYEIQILWQQVTMKWVEAWS